jgi:two-component sensor histidine kinase
VPDEPRIAALETYLPPRTSPDAELDHLTRFAAQLFNTPIAVISAVGTDRIRYASQSGSLLPDYHCQPGLCGSCVLQDEPWIICDAASDPRTAHHPHVAKNGVRFYCGVPLTTSASLRLGALAVMDMVPRQVSRPEVMRLKDLAHLAMQELELRRSREEALAAYRAELARGEIREDLIRSLMREVTHRSKNMLAVVLAFARQSALPGQTLGDYRARLISRVQGLAHTQDLIAEGDWRGADLGRLITSQLTPHLRDARQLHQKGPEITFLPPAAQHLGIALHELAANSVRTGALSADKGFVSVTWKVDAERSCLRLFWRERGGPVVQVPSHPGFGEVLLERVVPEAMEGLGRLSFDAAGLGWQLEVPTERVIAPQAK